jgi:hypothetical protein
LPSTAAAGLEGEADPVGLIASSLAIVDPPSIVVAKKTHLRASCALGVILRNKVASLYLKPDTLRD